VRSSTLDGAAAVGGRRPAARRFPGGGGVGAARSVWRAGDGLASNRSWRHDRPGMSRRLAQRPARLPDRVPRRRGTGRRRVVTRPTCGNRVVGDRADCPSSSPRGITRYVATSWRGAARTREARHRGYDVEYTSWTPSRPFAAWRARPPARGGQPAGDLDVRRGDVDGPLPRALLRRALHHHAVESFEPRLFGVPRATPAGAPEPAPPPLLRARVLGDRRQSRCRCGAGRHQVARAVPSAARRTSVQGRPPAARATADRSCCPLPSESLRLHPKPTRSP